MNKVVLIIIIFLGVFLMLLGLVFLMGAGRDTSNYVIGGVMILISLGLFVFLYLDSRNKAKQPKLLNQTVNVQLGGSGQFKEKGIKCKSCGGDVGEKDVKVISGGLTVKCPYCGSTYTLQEEPKW